MTASQQTGHWDSEYHSPVMVGEVLELLGECRLVLDGTLGGGGHAAALLARGAVVHGLDRDAAAIAVARRRLAAEEARGDFHAHHGNYSELDGIPALAGMEFDGILLDLGISSHQIDDSGRGFTFREGAPLDMRMAGEGDAESAADLLASRSERELTTIFRDYGDEPRAVRIAREVVRRRANRTLLTSDDLVGAIRGALGSRSGPAEFARIFQALRIAVNDELAGLERALPMLRDRLAIGGTLAIIAYHSGEDRLAKHAFREWSRSCICPPRHPFCTCRGRALGALLTPRPLSPAEEEVARNPRARSARLRAWRRGE